MNVVFCCIIKITIVQITIDRASGSFHARSKHNAQVIREVLFRGCKINFQLRCIVCRIFILKFQDFATAITVMLGAPEIMIFAPMEHLFVYLLAHSLLDFGDSTFHPILLLPHLVGFVAPVEDC